MKPKFLFVFVSVFNFQKIDTCFVQKCMCMSVMHVWFRLFNINLYQIIKYMSKNSKSENRTRKLISIELKKN